VEKPAVSVLDDMTKSWLISAASHLFEQASFVVMLSALWVSSKTIGP